MSELEGLKRQRSSYRGILTRLLKFATGINEDSEETIEEMRIKASRAKEILEKIDSVEASIFAINSEEESKMVDAEESYYTIVSTLNNWIKKLGIRETSNVNGDASLNMTNTNSVPEVRLAKLQIPTFSGDYTEWQSFFDLFHSSIHSRESITPVQKFQYLKGLLKGDAFSLVKHFKVTESNYIEALKKLRQRYDRKRHTINAFIRNFIEQPNVHVASASNIRKLLDTSDEVVRGLKALGDQAESRDPWLIFLLQQKLDDETRSLWAQENANTEFPTIQEFFDFLIKRTDALESLKAHPIRPTRAATSIRSKNSFASTTVESNCIACNKQQHKLIDCDRFKTISVEERRALLGSNRRCFNCLNPGHTVYDCRMRGRCRQCSRKHHSLVHMDNTSNALITTETSNGNSEENTVSTNHTRFDGQQVISKEISLKCSVQTVLPTAVVNIFDNLGMPRSCRALLDTASQASFITEALAQKLGLPRKNCRHLIKGIGQTNSGNSHGSMTLRLTSRFDTVQLASLEALIIPKITSSLPAVEFDISCMKKLSTFRLADPNFHRPGSIEILLGADIVFDLLQDDITKIDSSNLIAHKSKLGWIVGGRVEVDIAEIAQSFTTIVDIDATLQQFWAIEEIPQIKNVTQEEHDCEEWFKSTTRRADDGRFITKLPFKESSKIVGSTYQQAVCRLLGMEKRFKVNEEFRQLYEEFLKEYQDLNHMKPFKVSHAELQKSYILPHHGVLKSNSSTTKLRVVFDASANSTTGVSLNHNLMVGPNIQSSLLQILTRFRQHHYVLVGDIEKMYRQVWIDEEHHKHQLILWRDQKQIIRPYALKTVTYGMASASFMATRCLKELAQLHEEQYPEASRIIKHDIYVDDLMTGVSTLPELIKLKDDVLKILSSGGFNLRKLSSNDQQMRNLLNPAGSNPIKIISEHPELVKLLGTAWDARTDHFIFQVQLSDTEIHTKRSFLSEAGKIFDPLGLLSPITIRIKILFQSLWLKKIGWDEQLPAETRSSWIGLRNDICQAPELKIPRCIATSTSISIHGFCDASKWAYAAAVYARSQSNDKFVTHLICAKTKVAPLKQVSIPRLELMSAVLLSRLVKQITETLSIDVSSITMWTDSKIVLDWLSSQPRRWTTFVANRTSEIIGMYKRDLWRHVPSRYNPADCATRGKTAGGILSNELWWNGPAWLAREDKCWPDQPQIPKTSEEIQIEVHNTITVESNVSQPNDVIMVLSQKYSSYFKLKKVMSYMLRFVNNSRAKKHQRKRQVGALTPAELEMADRKIILYWQTNDFVEEYRCLQNGKSIPAKSKLRQLNPFLDAEGTMRVGGRIEKSALPYHTIHPAIISSKSPVAASITYDAHIQYKHPGPNLLTSLVRQNFWVTSGKNVAKNVFRKCSKCLRQRPKMMNQIMGQLPKDRVRFSMAFGAVGVDFCGPFKIHPMRRRGSIPVKAYLCIFVCFSTHAIHIEICMNLSTESFLGALHRFISRRGLCHTIYCDNATNFVGAKNYLQEIYNFISNNNNDIISSLLKDKIDWRFIPPAAPHQGGLWESAVKSTKTQITRTVGDTILTLEEFSTLTVQIEGILNSRPICSSHDDEIDFLTPAHFLIGRSIHQIPEAVTEQRLSPHSRWDIVKNIYQQFWRRWQVEYLTTLQLRSKWKIQQKNLQLNDVVILHDNNLPPAQWLMGRITKLYPGDDGKVRVAEIKTKNGTLKRPIQRLCRLPAFESDDDSTRGVCSDPVNHLK